MNHGLRTPMRPLDAYQVRFRTSMAIANAEEACAVVHDFEADADRERRLDVHECRRCFYLMCGRVAGQASTNWRCGVCGAERTHANTATPAACGTCAREHRLCTYCGGDIEMRRGRRKFPTPVRIEDDLEGKAE